MQPIFHYNPVITKGLVGAWGFKSAGQTANDVSSNNNDGSLEGGTIVQRDSSFLLDGSDDYITVGTDIGITNTSGTISAWFRANLDSVVTQYIVAHRDGDTSATRIYILVKSGEFSFGFGDEPDITVGDNIVGEWHYGLVKWNSSGAEAFLDGISVGTYDYSISSASGLVRIGAYAQSSAGGFFNGEISQASVYDRALTEDEITYIYKSSIPDDSLILHVDGTGKDITRYRHETTLNGDAIVGKYMEFDGSGDSILVPTSDVIDNAVRQPITISGWIKSPTFSTLNDQAFFVFKVDGSNWQAAVAQDDGSVRITNNIDGSGGGDNSSNFLTDDTWFFITWVIDGTTNEVYSNGELVSTIELSNSLSDIVGSPDFRIGTDGTSAFDFDGQINNVRIYDRALTEDEIKYMYNMEKKYY